LPLSVRTHGDRARARVVVHKIIAVGDYVWAHVNFLNLFNDDPHDQGIAGVDIYERDKGVIVSAERASDAVGDVATIGVPKAGVFAEGAARVVAMSLIASLRGGEQPGAYDGLGSCYIEFGAGRVGRVDVNFFSGPKPTGNYTEASVALVGEKQQFGSSREARWFGKKQ
jgi:hypothetical protein